ncbi:DNA -binding domain-containing protein [Azospirillum doebereinerae]
MRKPRIDAPVFDEAPTAEVLTEYDRLHLATYLRLLDAAADGADPDEVARIVLRIDPDEEPERARRAHDSHLSRARWMTENGYRQLLGSS